MGLFEDPQIAPPAPITAANMPTFEQPAAAPATQPGLFERVSKRIGDSLFQTPTALDGLVTDEDKAKARQQGLLSFGIALSQGKGENPLASLGRGLHSAQEGYQGAIDNVLTQRKNAVAMQQQQALQQKLAMHAKLAQQFMAQPGETLDATISRLTKYAGAMAAFDPESAAKLGDTISKLREPQGAAPHTIDAGGHKITIDRTGKVLRDDKVTPSPSDLRQGAASARADTRADATATRDERRQENTIVHDFNNAKPVKDYQGALAAYEVLSAAKNVRGGNFMRPMAALDAFARLLNPQGAVRVGTLQILKDQGAFGDKLARYVTMAQKGEWPEGMQQEIYKMAEQIMAEHTAGFDHYREETVSRAGAQGLDVDKFDKILFNRKQQAAAADPKKSTGKLGSY